jgi:chitodextrinase
LGNEINNDRSWLGKIYLSAVYNKALSANEVIQNYEAGSNTTSTDPDPDPEPDTDTEAPSAPTNLHSPSKTHSSISLNWTASTDNVGVTGYDVHRNNNKIASTNGSTTTYADSGLNPSTEYSYHVTAKDAAGNTSPSSSTLPVTTNVAPDTTPPTVSLTSPSNGALVTGTISVTATATDNTGVSKVEFLLNGNVVHSDTTSPYSYTWNTTNVGDGNHTLRARAFDAAGNTAQTSNATVTVKNQPDPDTEAPSSPANLAASNVTHNSLKLDWTASTDNTGVTGYRVYRNGNWLATATTNSYTDQTVQPTTAYSYYVVAFDAAGNLSGPSNTVNATSSTQPDTTPPTAPALSANATSSAVSLTWTQSTDNVGVTGYWVQRNGFTIANLSGSTSTSYTNNNVASGATYSYRVVAYDAAGNTTPSNTAQATVPYPPGPTDNEPPSTPANLRETASHPRYINMAWNRSTDNVAVAGYDIYRDGQKLISAAGASTTSFGDGTVRPNTSYRYHVRSFDAAGNQSTSSSTLNSFSHHNKQR